MRTNVMKLMLQNWKSGLTVSLVSLPLAIALSIASGGSPIQGIITAFWAGLIGAYFGGGNYNIIGPTGALSGLLISYALIHGSQALPLIALLSGSFIFLFYLLHFDKYIIFIPKSVVHGFSFGIAVLLALGQLDNILGIHNLKKTGSVVQNIWLVGQSYQQIDWIVLLIFMVSTIFIFFWDKKFSKFPGSIVIAVLSIIGMILFGESVLLSAVFTLGEQYPGLQVSLVENVFASTSWTLLLKKDFWVVSLAVAVISVLETLLSGQIAEQMTKDKFNRPKEVLGLALANLTSGIFGGIPATAALARTALNVKSGARNRTSGVLSSLIIGLVSLFLFSFFKFLPMVIIASILSIVAIRMVDRRHFIQLIEDEKISFFLSVLVAIIVVLEDPIVGIVVGTIIAFLIFINKVSYGQTELLCWKNGKMVESILKSEAVEYKEIKFDLVVYKISGTLTYINMPAHLEFAEKIRGNRHVIIALRHAFYADLDGIEYLKELIETLKANNEKVYLSGVNPKVHKLIIKQAFYKKKTLENKIFDRTSEAIASVYKSDF